MISKRKITAKRVAEVAGVSQTTVSFVLNKIDSANISEETKQRVLDAAAQLAYKPDAAARSLASGKSTNIALVLERPHPQVFIDEYIPSILTGLTRAVRKHRYRVLVELVDDMSTPDIYVDLIHGKEVAGIIINQSTAKSIPTLESFATQGFPIVALDNCGDLIPSVMVDKFQGVRYAVNHLINLGHRRIACIPFTSMPDNVHARTRLLVYRDVLETAKIAYDGNLVCYGNFDPETGYTAMKSLLQVNPLPTALFAMNDVMAFGAMRAIREFGLNVPQDIAIVGFDDIRLAGFSSPALTTIREPDIEHGFRAGEMLMKLIRGESVDNAHVVLPTELIIRDSCGYKLKPQA